MEHCFWPLRVTFSLGLLVPIGGISAAQLLVFQVVAIGNNGGSGHLCTGCYRNIGTDRKQEDNEQAVLQQSITNKQDALNQWLAQ